MPRAKKPVELTTRQRLEAVRDRLTSEFERAEGATAASVGKQLVEVLVRLDSMKVPEVSAVDDLTQRRAARRASRAPVADAPAAGGSKRSRPRSS